MPDTPGTLSDYVVRVDYLGVGGVSKNYQGTFRAYTQANAELAAINFVESYLRPAAITSTAFLEPTLLPLTEDAPEPPE